MGHGWWERDEGELGTVRGWECDDTGSEGGRSERAVRRRGDRGRSPQREWHDGRLRLVWSLGRSLSPVRQRERSPAPRPRWRGSSSPRRSRLPSPSPRSSDGGFFAAPVEQLNIAVSVVAIPGSPVGLGP